MSADQLPPSLARLIGQHPAALRSVRWARTPDEARAPEYLEIETKHGFVTLIDQRSGRVYAQPPLPPDGEFHQPRWQQDLTERLPCAFAGRPRFAAIEAIGQGAASIRGAASIKGADSEPSGWLFSFDTGAAFTLTTGDGIQIVSG